MVNISKNLKKSVYKMVGNIKHIDKDKKKIIAYSLMEVFKFSFKNLRLKNSLKTTKIKILDQFK